MSVLLNLRESPLCRVADTRYVFLLLHEVPWNECIKSAERGHEGAVKLLIAAHGIEPDHKDVHGQTPLALASASGHQAVVKLLLATNRVDPDSKDSDGRTPLSTAAQNWHEKVVRLPLTARVDPTSKDTSELTPLDWAKRGKRGRWNERV